MNSSTSSSMPTTHKQATLKVKITASSSKNSFLSWLGDELKVALQAPPEKGKANRALIKFMAQNLNIGEHQIEISQGHSQAHKILRFELLPEELLARLPPNTPAAVQK